MCFQLTSEYIMYIPCIYQYILCIHCVYTVLILAYTTDIACTSCFQGFVASSTVFQVSTATMCPTTQCVSCWVPGNNCRTPTMCPLSETHRRFALSWKLSERNCWIKMERHVTGARTGYVFDGIYNVYTWYMHDIYCVYTIYIKKIWTAYAENLNVIYIVYVKYIPSK